MSSRTRAAAALVRMALLLGLGGVAMASARPAEGCSVAIFEAVDLTRTRARPFASGSDPEAAPSRVRALLYSPARTPGVALTYAALVAAEGPEDGAEATVAASLAFHGLPADRHAISAALATRSACDLALARGAPPRATVVVLAALPAVFYEGLARRLAERGIATLVARAGEAEARLLLQELGREAGRPADRVALVGHGAGSSAAALLAMGWNGVRARVSLDGFEALARDRHPGLSTGRDWRPGHERAPVLLVRPRDRPHGDLEHYERAARVELTRLEVGGLEAGPWATAAQLAFAPEALRPLLPGLEPGIATRLVDESVAFLDSALLSATPAPTPLPEALERWVRPPLPAPAIVADGRLDEPVWGDAGPRRGRPGELGVEVRQDCHWLYFALLPGREEPFTSELYLDANGAGGERRDEDDLTLHASQSLCFVRGDRDLAPSDCGASEAWWTANRTARAGDSRVAEYAVAKSRLGLAECASAEAVRFAATVSGFGAEATFPPAAARDRPSTWSALLPAR